MGWLLGQILPGPSEISYSPPLPPPSAFHGFCLLAAQCQPSLYDCAGKAKGANKKRNKNIVRPGTKPKKDIKSMFAAAAATSKKKPEVGFTTGVCVWYSQLVLVLLVQGLELWCQSPVFD